MATTDPVKQIERIIAQSNIILRNEIERTLKYLGEQCVKRVRDRSGEDSWYDQTGNLRSSIGYAIYEHGIKQIESSFAQVLHGTKGASIGRQYVESLASMYSSTYAIVVVAAMSYADFVEAKENKDVLASTELWARGVVDGYILKAKQKAEREIQRYIDEN